MNRRKEGSTRARSFVYAAVALASLAWLAGGCGSHGPVVRVAGEDKTCCVVTDDDNHHAAFLVNLDVVTAAVAELHVVNNDGGDRVVDTGIARNSYLFTHDGKTLLYTKHTTGAAGDDAALYSLDVTNNGSKPQRLVASGLPLMSSGSAPSAPLYTEPLANVSLLSTSGRFLLLIVVGAGTPDAQVLDLSNGKTVLQAPYAADYVINILPDDTILYMSVNGGTDPAGPPPVPQLNWASLTDPSMHGVIDQRVVQVLETNGGKQIVYLRGDGQLWSWDGGSHARSSTPLATNVSAFNVSFGGNSYAWLGNDHAVHMRSLDGKRALDLDASAAQVAAPFSPLLITPDGNDLFYFQNLETQNRRGTLLHTNLDNHAVAKLGDHIGTEIDIVDDGILYFANVDDKGAQGTLTHSQRDGSQAMGLNTTAPLGDLAIGRSSGGWSAAHHTTLRSENNMSVDGSPGLIGPLALAQKGMAAGLALDPQVHLGGFSIADDASAVAWASGSAYDSMRLGYVGKLKLLTLPAKSQADQDNMLKNTLVDGVTEVGPIANRSLFVNAPAAGSPGVYYVTY